MYTELEISKMQRDQLAHYIVQIAVALGLVDGDGSYNENQVAFLAEQAVKTICNDNQKQNKAYAEERKALLDAVPRMVPL